MKNHQIGFAEVNDAKFYYETAGDPHNQAVVFLHASVADRRMWDSQFDVFAEKYYVIRYDQREIEETEGQSGEFDPVQDLAELLAYLNIGSAAVVGCSMGGVAAIDFTLTHPEKVWALVLSGSGVPGFDYDPPEDELAMMMLEGNIGEAFKAGDLEKAADWDIRLWLDGPRRPEGAVGDPLRAKMREMLSNAYQNHRFARFTDLTPPTITRLGEIKVPTLILIGAADMPDIVRVGDVLEKQVGGSRKIVYPNTAHMLNMEIPDKFNADVLAFLAQAKS